MSEEEGVEGTISSISNEQEKSAVENLPDKTKSFADNGNKFFDYITVTGAAEAKVLAADPTFNLLEEKFETASQFCIGYVFKNAKINLILTRVVNFDGVQECSPSFLHFLARLYIGGSNEDQGWAIRCAAHSYL